MGLGLLVPHLKSPLQVDILTLPEPRSITNPARSLNLHDATSAKGDDKTMKKAFKAAIAKLRLGGGPRAPPLALKNDSPFSLPQSYSQIFCPAWDLSILPPELWSLIYSLATAIPSPSSEDDTHCFLSASDPDSPCDLGLYQESMKDKKTLSLVSKEWNGRSQGVLYEFVWIRRASQAKVLANTLQSQSNRSPPTLLPKTTSGTHIRWLHISTRALERCAMEDIRTILDFAPNLVTYSDHHSVRRNRFDYALNPNPRCSPKELFDVLAHPKNQLKRLSWTHYTEDEGESFPFHITPVLQKTVTSSVLEYLELCSENFYAGYPMGSGGLEKECLMSTMVTLPVLKSLKVTLDNTTFSVLSAWEMPLLTNLSIVSSDFSCASIGFSQFFLSHGPKLLQLELGHSSSLISEHYLTSPPLHSHNTPRTLPPLAVWCPNLTSFICSADSEWNWQTPDFIAPHILLPSHPNIRLIGIRDIDRRLRYDVEGSPWGGNTQDDAPFFGLVEWVGSLVGREMFPSLYHLRDMSRESAQMRGAGAPLLIDDEDDEEERPVLEERVLKFWDKVFDKCQVGGVWIEDWKGVSVTRKDLRRGWKVLNEGRGFTEDGTF